VISQQNPDLAKALSEVLAFAQQSGNPEAEDLAGELIEGAKNGKRGVVRAMWDGLVRILPDLASLGSAASTITTWLGS
jgi:hypothetical protein